MQRVDRRATAHVLRATSWLRLCRSEIKSRQSSCMRGRMLGECAASPVQRLAIHQAELAVRDVAPAHVSLEGVVGNLMCRTSPGSKEQLPLLRYAQLRLSRVWRAKFFFPAHSLRLPTSHDINDLTSIVAR